jgi:hypothetical protein
LVLCISDAVPKEDFDKDSNCRRNEVVKGEVEVVAWAEMEDFATPRCCVMRIFEELEVSKGNKAQGFS